MTRMILHIGPGKTGSTTLQDTLSVLGPELGDGGLRYPTTARLLGETEEYLVPRYPSSVRRVAGRRRDHQVLAWSLKYFPDSFNLLWGQLCEEVTEAGARTVVLSGKPSGELTTSEAVVLRPPCDRQVWPMSASSTTCGTSSTGQCRRTRRTFVSARTVSPPITCTTPRRSPMNARCSAAGSVPSGRKP